MAFEILSQAYANIFQDLMRQRSPAGQADIMGQQLQNKAMEAQLRDMFPLQVEKLQKEIDFMISPEEEQALELQKQQFIAGLQDQLAEAAAKRRYTRETDIQGIRGQQALDQIDREWFYRLQLKKMPSLIQHIGGDTEKSPEQYFQELAASGKFNPDMLDRAYQNYLRTGQIDFSLVRGAQKQPEFGAVDFEQTEQLRADIINSSEFQSLMDKMGFADEGGYKKKGFLGADVLAKDQAQKLFNDILAGKVDISGNPELQKLMESYRYSAAGIPPQTEIAIPEFNTKDEYINWVDQNIDKIANDPGLRAFLNSIEQEKGW